MPGMGHAPGAGDSEIVHQFHTALGRQAALIFVVLLLLFVAWNGLRSLQYRRAAAKGEPFPPDRRRVAPEPPARRMLRIGFGVLWVIDGLLQLQQAMPLGMPPNVLRPAASNSPEWVQRLVGFGVEAWTRHPTSAAASAVWIQVGIGLFLLVAPRGYWSRLAGLGSVGWGLVVWVFGEAFGGLFAPGLTVLFGAPGGVLLYVVAGGLVALPDRAWVGQRLGRTVTATAGAFLLAHGRSTGLARSRVLARRDLDEARNSGRDGGADGRNIPAPFHIVGRRIVWLVRHGPRVGGQSLRGGGLVRAGSGPALGSPQTPLPDRARV